MTPAFRRHVAERMAAGAREYDDRSWRRDPADLCAEMAEEAADLAGWGALLRARLLEADPALRSFVAVELREVDAAACELWGRVRELRTRLVSAGRKSWGPPPAGPGREWPPDS
ncbi:MAG: hypothetical protein ABII82_13365 [Verrucomicrobiota bacterium]